MMVWEGLEEQGACPPIPEDEQGNSLPGPAIEEYRRVFQAWKAAGCPETIGDFIRRTVRR